MCCPAPSLMVSCGLASQYAWAGPTKVTSRRPSLPILSTFLLPMHLRERCSGQILGLVTTQSFIIPANNACYT